MGFTTHYGYDAENYMTSLEVGGRVVTFAYDESVAPKRIAAVTDEDGAVVKYGKSSVFEVTPRMPWGNTAYFAKSSSGETVATVDGPATPPAGASPTAWPTEYIDEEGASTRIEYDARGNITKWTEPLRGLPVMFTMPRITCYPEPIPWAACGNTIMTAQGT